MIIFMKNVAKNKKRKQCAENKSCFTWLSQADTAAFNRDCWSEVGRDTRVAAARTSIQKGNYPLPLEVTCPLAWSTWPWQPALALGNFVWNTSDAACSWLKKKRMSWSMGSTQMALWDTRKDRKELRFICNFADTPPQWNKYLQMAASQWWTF